MGSANDAAFVHLHLHSEYSLLDGAIRIDRLVARVRELGMEAVAVTDHGNLHGAVEFYTKARAAGIKPILGIEAYVAPRDRRERAGGEGAFHLVLLAENNRGWRNLVKLSSDAFINGFYYRPRMDKTMLAEFADGIIAINGHLGSSIAHHLTQYAHGGDDTHWQAACEEARWHAATFGPNDEGEPRFYLEIQRHGIEAQDRINPLILRLAAELDLPIVADNDTHFLLAEDADIHDSLCCISMGKTKEDESRLRYSPELFLKSHEQMAELFADCPEAIEHTASIARRCHVELDTSANHAPMVRALRHGEPSPYAGGDRGAWFRDVCLNYELAPYDAADSQTPLQEVRAGCDVVLRELCEAGLVWRYGPEGITPEIRQRLDWELSVLANKLISAYFLIVWDFVNWARQQGIPAGARGSGVGTMVGYSLGLSHACPLRYGLLFERFTDPDRSEYPDIDVDICQNGRARVIEYVRQKYGYVAQIITFGRLKARAAIKDVARVMGLTPSEGQRLSNFVPNELHITLEASLAREPDFAAEYEGNTRARQVIDTAKALEGHARHAGVHAAGVVIATEPLDNIVPLYRAQGSDDAVTQWDGPTCEKMGLLKMDFLGLRTLSTIERACELVRETLPKEAIWRAVGHDPADGGPHPVDLERLTYDDPRVFELFARADTAGVFQFESGGMRRLLADMKPDRIEDLIAANALFRPGPMDLIPDYIRRKHGQERVPSVHPIVDEHTAETYGIMVYQEQVMQIVHGLGDIPLRQAYTLIKAISKKSRAVVDALRPKFIEGAEAKGLSQRRATDLFELILKFAGYGFNKCVIAETQIIDAETGERTNVGDLFDRFQQNSSPRALVHALGHDGRLRRRRVTDVVWNGRRPVFRLRTRARREIVTTANHPFRTLDGWTTLADLGVGDRIASARALEVPSDAAWPRHELIALAGLISEGNTCHPTCLYFYNNDRRLIDDFVAASIAFPETRARIDRRSDNRMEVCVSSDRPRQASRPQSRSGGSAVTVAGPKTPVRSGMFRWAQRHGLLGRRATEKRIPGEVFEVRDTDLELFLGRLWAGDGFVSNHTNFTPYYATSSQQLAEDVRTLLLRLGILSTLYCKRFKYRGGYRVGYTVHLFGDSSIATFSTRIGPHCLGREADLQRLQEYLGSVVSPDGRGRSSRDTIPAEVRRWVDRERQTAGLTWRELEKRSGLSMKEFCGRGSRAKRGFRRSTVAALAAFFGSRSLQHLAESDVYWDEVVSIEPAGIRDVYDLTVDGDHNFVADGLVVHNSHSTGYAIIAYQTAYLKTYFPNQYMAALLTFESAARKVEDWVPYLEDCKVTSFPDSTPKQPHRGVEVKPPDVNLSEARFSVVFMPDEEPDTCRGHVRFGLGAIRGVSSSAIAAIIADRKERGPFESIFDFCERVDLSCVNRPTIEALVKSGALDSLHEQERRAAVFAVLDNAIAAGQGAADDRKSGQLNFLASMADETRQGVQRDLPRVAPWDRLHTLAAEKEVLGFHVSGHPLDVHDATLARWATGTARSCAEQPDKTEVRLGGVLAQVRTRIVKNGRSAGQKMALCSIQDKSGSIEAVIFSEAYARFGDKVVNDAIVAVTGKVDRVRGEPSVVVDQVLAIEDLPRHLAGGLELDLVAGPEPERDESTMQEVERLLRRAAATNGGRQVGVMLNVLVEGKRVALKPHALKVVPEDTLLGYLRDLLGDDHVRLVARTPSSTRS